MDIISPLQQKVNRVVGKSTSLDEMAHLCRSEGDKGQAFWVYLSELWQMVGGRGGVISREDEIWALASVVVWISYLRWMREWLRWRRGACLRRWSVARVLRRFGMEDQALNLLRCGEHVYDMECCQCGYVHKVTYHCKLRVCPSCSWVRQIDVVEGYSDGLKSLGELRFMTLTLKNVADLGAGVEKIRACFKKLRLADKKKAERLGLSLSYKDKIWGGLYGIECPVGNDGLWNIHLHCVYAGRYILQEKLADDWERLTGDSRVCHVRKVQNTDKDVGYVSKYACEQNEALIADGDKLGEYMSVLYGVRLVQSFGRLLGLKKEKDVFVCPECGGCVWRVRDARTGGLVFDGLEYLRARASPVEYFDLV